jgi:hypothetical protein
VNSNSKSDSVIIIKRQHRYGRKNEMGYIIPLIGFGSLFIFLFLLIVGIVGKCVKARWGKKVLISSLVPLLIFGICILITRVNVGAEGKVNAVNSEEVKLNIDHFDYEIKTVEYKEVINEMHITLETNIPDGTEVTVGLNKIHEDGFEIEDVILNKLTFERETYTIEDGGKLNLFYSPIDENIPMVNGQYGVWLDFEVGSFINEDLHGVMGKVEEANNKFKENNISDHADEGDYTVILGQKYFDLTDSISYDDYKKKVKNDSEEIRFALLDKNPDKHTGDRVKFEGQIVQIMEDESSTIIRLAVTKDSYGYDMDDIMYITYDTTTPFVEDDIINVYGVIQGSETYESQAGYQITLPSMDAEIIE